MKGAELFVRCLENEGVQRIFGIPGEENLDVMDALLDSSIHFVTTRHEQGAAFMADVHGRLTGQAGVCLATLGPGACNLVTGVADANMDHAPVVAIAGQADTSRMHKESHQVMDLARLFEPISKYSVQIREPGIIPEVLRKAFKAAETEKPGVSFVELPENVADEEVPEAQPLKVQSAQEPFSHPDKVRRAGDVINAAQAPLIMAGNGVCRGNASADLLAFAEKLGIPVATTFMAKGAFPSSHPLSLGTVGLQARDHVSCGFDRADVILCVGYDMVEYHPHLWHGEKHSRIVHVDVSPAEVDEHYILEVGVVGNIAGSLRAMAAECEPRQVSPVTVLRQTILDDLQAYADDAGFPLKPQKIVHDLRQALAPEDIVICDVGAHKMWMARMYQAEVPNTCIISNGFASMGIAVPGAIAAKLCHPERKIVAVTGDAGFLMNSQEIETALRIGTPLVILIWTDEKYGLIEWHQNRRFGRTSNIDFKNPDFVKYAESFGAVGYRVTSSAELLPTLRQALQEETVVLIDCPVDYSENMKLTEKLGQLQCRI